MPGCCAFICANVASIEGACIQGPTTLGLIVSYATLPTVAAAVAAPTDAPWLLQLVGWWRRAAAAAPARAAAAMRRPASKRPTLCLSQRNSVSQPPRPSTLYPYSTWDWQGAWGGDEEAQKQYWVGRNQAAAQLAAAAARRHRQPPRAPHHTQQPRPWPTFPAAHLGQARHQRIPHIAGALHQGLHDLGGGLAEKNKIDVRANCQQDSNLALVIGQRGRTGGQGAGGSAVRDVLERFSPRMPPRPPLPTNSACRRRRRPPARHPSPPSPACRPNRGRRG